MIVYMLEVATPHEASELIGLYSTLEKAKKLAYEIFKAQVEFWTDDEIHEIPPWSKNKEFVEEDKVHRLEMEGQTLEISEMLIDETNKEAYELFIEF